MRLLPISGLCCCLLAWGQTESGAIVGSVFDPAHAPASGVSVECRNIETGTDYKALSSAEGKYNLVQLPPGKYDMFVISTNYRPFVRRGVVIVAGQSAPLDIQLSSNVALLGTLGEMPALFELLSKKPPPPQGPAPRLPDGKPDFSGVWLVSPSSLGGSARQPDLLPWARALFRERLLNDYKDKPSARCLPELPGFLARWPIKIVQTPKLLVTLRSDDVISAHQVYLDGRSFPKDLESSWQGYSIGKWEGDTLVIDTVGLNDQTWLNMFPHTGKLHITERLRRPDLGHLEVETTYDDPESFKTPFQTKVVNVLAPDEEVEEYVCAENNQYREHVNTN
jgi:Carboxypeptidase regulatory-like domain